MNNIELQEKLGRRLLKEVAYNCSISDKLNQQSFFRRWNRAIFKRCSKISNQNKIFKA